MPAEDTLKTGAELPPLAKLKIAEMNEKSTRGLHDWIEIALGMKAMVLVNIATEADIANGTTRTIEDILLDPRESKTINADAEGRVQLKYPPALFLFRPNKETDLSHVSRWPRVQTTACQERTRANYALLLHIIQHLLRGWYRGS